ncbi:MAG: acetate--CoA ligase family protein [Pseudomonadota bacterium]|nr:acetate--CoA ligase family protein [Pseudomonadota bacterium]
MSDASSLARLFEPRSIAIVGASASPDKPGWHIVNMLSDFNGAVYPVNPREAEILGRKAYKRLADIPEPVDLVALVVPPAASVAVLREAAQAGVGAAFMISGGFGETGDAGQAQQDEALAICRGSGMRLLGPNTSGFVAPESGAFCTFMPGIQDMAAGGISIAAQSGGINITLALIAHRDGHGIRLAVGLGNAADVALPDVIDYLTNDDGTEAIALHLEGVTDGRGLYEAIRRATRIKPVVALPVGRADLGGFAESHTGNLMGSFELTRNALIQAGAVVCGGLAELIDAAHALATSRLPPIADPGVGILTGQAGPGLLMTDALRHAGVAVPELTEASFQRIGELLPPMTYMKNPVDTGRPSATFADVAQTTAADRNIDALLVWALLEDDLVDLTTLGQDIRRNHDIPVIIGTGSTSEIVAPTMTRLREGRVPGFDTPDGAARAMRALAQDSRTAWRQRQDGNRVAPTAPKNDIFAAGPLDENAAKELIAVVGIPVPRRAVCNSRERAADAMLGFGVPVAVKILDPAVTHKTELGGVHLGIETQAALDAALDAIDAIPGDTTGRNFLVEEMAPPGVEIIIGGANDARFGPTVLLGLGGTAAEAMGDVTMRLAPLGWNEAASMIEDLQGRTLLEGWRGAAAVDRKAICRAIVAVGDLMIRHGEIRELDLNPVRVYPDGLLALDALVVI